MKRDTPKSYEELVKVWNEHFASVFTQEKLDDFNFLYYIYCYNI